MISKQDALQAKTRALNAIRELSQLLNGIKGKCSEEEFGTIKKAVGLAIGRIQTDILDAVIAGYPELDDLK